MTHVFLSSTSKDLGNTTDPDHNYRAKVSAGLRKAGFDVIEMEDFGAQSGDAESVSLSELSRAEVVVGIYALRYGFIPSGSTQSITEMEFNWALEQKKALFCFLFDPEAAVKEMGWVAFSKSPLNTESDRINADKLEAFHKRILGRVVSRFTTPETLTLNVVTSLTRWVQHGKPADTTTLPPLSTTTVTQNVQKNDGIMIGVNNGTNNTFTQNRS